MTHVTHTGTPSQTDWMGTLTHLAVHTCILLYHAPTPTALRPISYYKIFAVIFFHPEEMQGSPLRIIITFIYPLLGFKLQACGVVTYN